MNEILDIMKKRRSCRDFKSDMLPDEIISQICEAGTYAPTGKNFQSPIIIAVTDKKLRDELSAMNAKIMGKGDFDPFYHAPVILIVLADKTIPTHVYDGSLVMQNLMLAAESLEIGSIWIHRAKEEFETQQGKAILKRLGITGEYEGIGHCAIGYANSEPNAPSPRKENYIYKI
ncbi:MAG: nitroreductase [Oscillospiraceae bacterium]|nr:nitroreductase [Oscillospiraceae bacterium]